MVDIDQCQSRESEDVGRPAPVAVEEHRHRDGRHALLLHFLVGLGLAEHVFHLPVVAGPCLDMAVVADQPFHLFQPDGFARYRREVLEKAQSLLLFLLHHHNHSIFGIPNYSNYFNNCKFTKESSGWGRDERLSAIPREIGIR